MSTLRPSQSGNESLGWVALVCAILLPLGVAIVAWQYLQEIIGNPWWCLFLIGTAQIALGCALLMRNRTRAFSIPLQVLDATVHQLLKIRRRHRLARLIPRLLVRAFNAAHATVFLEDPITKTYRLSASHGIDKPTSIQELDASSLLIQWLLKHRRGLRANECRSGEEFLQESDGKRVSVMPVQKRLQFILQNLDAELVVPSLKRKKLVGFVALGRRKNRHSYSHDEVAALSRLANSCAVALENARHFEELEAAAQKLSSTQNMLIEQQRMADAGKLAMGLAHEIRNPLTGIKTFTEFLLEKYDDPQFREEFVRIIPAEVARITRIVQSLSDFAQPPLLKLKATDVQQVLSDTISLLSNECLKRDVHVTKQFESEPVYLNADPAALKQAFLNICLNALDAMENGGNLSIHSQLEGTIAVIRISDTGVGIRQEHLATLFNPFFTTKQGGMGLGLAVVKQIVNQHLGVILVESNVGYGTTFEIRLPHAVRIQATQRPSYTPSVSDTPHKLAAPIHVLIVDDELKIQELLREHFESLGAQVRSVSAGEEALPLMAQAPAELIVLDLKLPSVDGFEVLKGLKGRFPMVAVVVITGMYDEQIDAYVRSLGALACLHKPIDLSRLQELAYQVAARSCPPTPA